jgi:hypothetical protein
VRETARLTRVIPKWVNWAERAAHLDVLSSADYPFPSPTLKSLGVIVQRYRLRSGAPTQGFEQYFQRLATALNDLFWPALRGAGVLLPDNVYQDVGLEDGQWLASIPDFATLIADSQRVRKPVFSLTQEDVRRVGMVWENTEEVIERFRGTFENLARRVEALTNVIA